MSFKEYITVKRTKMIDEASFGHKPLKLGQSILAFVIFYIIVSLLEAFIVGIPTYIYTLRATQAHTGLQQLISDYTSGLISADEYSSAYNAIALEIAESLPSWLGIVSLFATTITIIACIYFCVKRENRPITSMGIRKNGAVPEYLLGALIGGVMFSLAYLFAYVTGSVEVSGVADKFQPIIIVYLLAFIIQGASEEFLVRGYFMVSLARDNRASVAIGVSSLAFGLLHLFNSGFNIIAFINIVLFGIFLGIYVYKRGSIFGACAIHSMWNFIQGNVFGVSVSGSNAMPSIISTKMGELDIINGGDFGLEGGLAVTLIIVIAIAVLLFTKTKESEISEVQIEYFA